MNKSTFSLSSFVLSLSGILCLILAAFLRFAMTGYSFMSNIFLCLCAVFSVYILLFWFSTKNPKRAKTLLLIFSGAILAALSIFIVIQIPIIAASRTDRDPEADYVIVLGAGVNGIYPSLSMLNRLNAAYHYLQKYPDSIAVVSGGQGEGEDITEAEAMRRYLEDNGIEPERIIKEERSTSTKENIEYSLEMIERHGGDPTATVAIVSSEYHLYRAKSIAEKLGAVPVAVAGETTNFLLKINYFIREGFAVIHLWVFGL